MKKTKKTRAASLRELWKKYNHYSLFFYVILYLVWFKMLENKENVNYHLVHTSLDDKLPFIEWFVIPYFLWFGYIAYVLLKLSFYSKPDFIRSFVYIFGGMTIGLVIFTFFPTVQDLRPEVMPRDNLLTRLIAFLYTIDTPTNVAPSLHVYNSVGAYIAIRAGRAWFSKIEERIALLLTILISLSTVFIKQHSTFDVWTGALMSFLMYLVLYFPETLKKAKKCDSIPVSTDEP